MNTLSSVTKALDIIDAVAKSGRRGIGTRELSRVCGINVTSVHNIASTLKVKGFIHQDTSSKKYTLGLHLLSLGDRNEIGMALAELARPVIGKLSDELHESVLLAGIIGGKLLKLDYITSTYHPLNVQKPDNIEPYAHCMACGKILLATLSQEELKKYLSSKALSKHTNHTITNTAQLAGELYEIVDQGYAETHDELCEGISAIAVPIKDKDNNTVAAIGVSMPTVRFKPSSKKTVLKHLQSARHEIEDLIFKEEL